MTAGMLLKAKIIQAVDTSWKQVNSRIIFQGRLVKHIITPDKSIIAGFYRVSWDGKTDAGRSLAAGPYIYRITA
jgi:flagellar hook assembly protein FlgD